MFSSLITKRINNLQKNSVHVIGLHDVTATVDKTPLCKIWKSLPTQKVTLHLNSVVLNLTEFYWILKNILKFMNFTEFLPRDAMHPRY